MKLKKNHIYIYFLILFNSFLPSIDLYSSNLPDSLKSPRLLGITYESKGIAELEKYYKNTIYISKNKSDLKTEILATIYLADIYRYKNKHDSSFKMLMSLRNIINKNFQSDVFIRFQFHKTISTSFFYKFLYEKMMSNIDSALGLRNHIQYDSIEIGDLYYLKFLNYDVSGQYDLALNFLLLSQKSYPKNYKEKDSFTDIIILAELYRLNGYYKKAEEILFKTLNNCDPNYPFQKSLIYLGLGEHFYRQKDYEKSKYFFKQKLSYDSAFNISNGRERRKVFLNIGVVLYYERKFPQSIHYFHKAIESYTYEPSNDLFKAEWYIGKSYYEMDSLKAAEFHLRRILKVAKQSKNKVSTFNVAYSYIEYGLFKTTRLKDKTGINYINSGLKILEQKFDLKHDKFVNPLIYLADSYKNLLKDYQTSLLYLEKALQINFDDTISNYIVKVNPSRSKIPSTLITILGRKIILFIEWIKSEESLNKKDSLYQALYNTILSYNETEELIRANIKNNESKLTRTSLHKRYISNALRGLHLLFKETGDIKYIKKFYEYSAKNKAITLQESLLDSKAKYSHLPDSLIKLEEDYNRQIGSLNNLISQENENEKPRFQNINNWENQLNNVIILKDQLIHKFETDYPQYYKLKHDQHYLSVEEVQNNLKKDQALIEYSVLNDSSIYIFGITKDQFEFIPIEANDTIFKKLETLLDIININNILKFNSLKLEEFKSSSRYLYNTLLKPFSDLIQDKDLIINPDDRLWYLPFEVLLTEDMPQSVSYHDLPYLVKTHPISYAYSTRLLFDPISPKKKTKKSLLTVVPSYDKKIDFEKEVLENNTDRSNFSPIPASIKEAEYVHKIWGGKLLKGDKASEKNFKEIADQYSILHMAMHAVIDNKNPQFSKLVFTQGVDTTEDNFLNTYEIYNKPLNAQMAVLSSCKSGAGKMQKGEGIISIARAFLYAGCPSLVITLWSVDDIASARLMQYYYDFLKQGMSKSKALQQAKVKFLETASPIYQHPYFWAPYTLIGNNDPIKIKKNNEAYFILAGVVLVILIFLVKRRKHLMKLVKN